MITDNEAIKAMNTLTDYCKERVGRDCCDSCKVVKKCRYLRTGYTFIFGGHLPLEGAVEAEKLATNMAAAIMNRRD